MTVISRATFSACLTACLHHDGRDDAQVASAIHISAGYMSKFIRGVGEAWAKRLVLFMRETRCLAPLQKLADEMGCDVVVRKEGAAGLGALWVHPDHAGKLPAGAVAMPAQVHAAEVLRAQQQAHRRNRAATLHSWALMGPAQPLRPLEAAQEGPVRITRGAPLPDHRFCAEPGAVGGGFMAERRARRAGGAQ